jgi:hypothetical protein
MVGWRDYRIKLPSSAPRGSIKDGGELIFSNEGGSTSMRYQFDTPARFSIRVLGTLDKSWSDRLGGMEIQNFKAGESGEIPLTSLTGLLIDQAALLGVINTLYNMHYPLLSLEYLGDLSIEHV